MRVGPWNNLYAEHASKISSHILCRTDQLDPRFAGQI